MLNKYLNIIEIVITIILVAIVSYAIVNVSR